MIKLYKIDEYDVLGDELGTNFFSFPDGTRHVKIDSVYNNDILFIESQMSTSSDVIDLLLVKDAIDHMAKGVETNVFIPYILGSRQDRYMVDGEPLSAKVYANLINSANFTSIMVLDPHSNVITALMNNVEPMELEYYYKDVPVEDPVNSVVISPDAGAVKRATYFAQFNEIETLVKADKQRDLDTGKITSFELYTRFDDDLEGKDVYIVDDICTGGGTFLGLLEEIDKQNPKSTNLVVTHADNNKGLIKMSQYFDHVYVTNSKKEFETANMLSNVTVVNILT